MRRPSERAPARRPIYSHLRNLHFAADVGSLTVTSNTAIRKYKDVSDADIQGLAAEFLQIFTLGRTTSSRQFSEELRLTSPAAGLSFLRKVLDPADILT
jgi:hypothetical protein